MAEKNAGLVQENALHVIESHFAVAMGDPAPVEEALAALQQDLHRGGPENARECCRRLLPLLAERKGALARSLFRFLKAEVSRESSPCELLGGMLRARDLDLRQEAMDLLLNLAEEEKFTPDSPLILSIARLVEKDECFRAASWSNRIGAMLRKLPQPEPQEKDAVEALFLAGSPPVVRRLAARILDQSQTPPPENRVTRLLGPENAGFLMPYLEYTRATHQDLVDLTPDPARPAPVIPSLMEAERIVGRTLLATVIAGIGWPRLARGVAVQHLAALSFEGSFPFVMRAREASLLEDACPSRRLWDRFLVIAHGGSEDDPGEGSSAETVQRFRRYNIAHAEVLTELLEVAPLTSARVRKLLDRMDRIVEDFQALFRNETEDATRLPVLYEELRAKVVACIKDGESAAPSLSPGATRLVQVFEDPFSLDEVTTIHGLKRYLHQAGLRLAFRLFRSGCATNRTIDLLLASQRGIHAIVRQIHYIDFEPQQEDGVTQLPMVVQLAVDAFARQLLHGLQTFPKLELLIYGNEVQVYAGFRNHPAFIRLDFSPPLRGGMIDLEYFAVSQYEMDQHPDLSLQAIQRLFRRLEFDVRKDGFRLRARYDRERAFDFGDISQKAGMLFCLVPHLMDLDWRIGSLDYPEPARAIVAGAWSEFFASWGVLPAEVVVTANRRILRACVRTPAGEQEVMWNGHEPYQDVLSGTPRADLLEVLWKHLHSRGTLALRQQPSLHKALPSQLALEKDLLQPLRDAQRSGEIQATDGCVAAATSAVFVREHEAERFASILSGGGDDLVEAAQMGALIASIERQVQFRMSGSLQGFAVQRALLHLCGEQVGLFVLRDEEGQIALGLASLNETLCRSRKHEMDPWARPDELNEPELALRLRRDNYLGTALRPMSLPDERWKRFAETFRTPSRCATSRALPGERIVAGLAAAPGRTTGRLLFGNGSRRPEDFVECIYAAPAIRPEDAPFLFRASGVLTTGGGTLSHAGLVALELQKPALIIPGSWIHEAGKRAALKCRIPEFQEIESEIDGFSVICRNETAEQELDLLEGDLVLLDADESCMTVLGQDQEILNFHQGIRQVEGALGRMENASDARETLQLRGRLVHAMHQLERVLARTGNPVLARYAVQELLTPNESAQGRPIRSETSHARLLQVLISNPHCRSVAQETAIRWASRLAERHNALCRHALTVIPALGNIFEVLFLRLKVLRLRSLLMESAALLQEANLRPPAWTETDMDQPVLRRLTNLHQSLESAMRRTPATPPASCERRHILNANDGGSELSVFIGRKASGLAEIGRILGHAYVPPWFALTESAFRTMLESQAGKGMTELGFANAQSCTLENGIRQILEQPSDAARKAAAIRHLWLGTQFPEDMQVEILNAYRALGPAVAVAVRSSAFEEDTEETAFPGQFDTFVFLAGDHDVLHHVRLAWAGLWSERAIHMRGLLKHGRRPPGGGLVIQKMVRSRVSGVVHTVSLATEQLTEMAINAGLGLGEGVVSGTVDVDQILVNKPPRKELQFHYRVGDKREQIVPDTALGHGTRKVESQYHQRFRPALEYTELCDLVAIAAKLESAYGEPLDIEFAWEGQSLYILQVRPITVFHAALRETCKNYPLPKNGAAVHCKEDQS